MELLPAMTLGILGLCALTLAWLYSGQTSSQYLVIAPYNATHAESIALIRKAGGRIAAFGMLPNIMIADATHPQFAQAIQQAGAWLAVSVPPQANCAQTTPVEHTL